jgi:hypothetical protein
MLLAGEALRPSDDGSGFVLSEAGARIWVGGAQEQEPILESAYRGMAPLWIPRGRRFTPARP